MKNEFEENKIEIKDRMSDNERTELASLFLLIDSIDEDLKDVEIKEPELRLPYSYMTAPSSKWEL